MCVLFVCFFSIFLKTKPKVRTEVPIDRTVDERRLAIGTKYTVWSHATILQTGPFRPVEAKACPTTPARPYRRRRRSPTSSKKVWGRRKDRRPTRAPGARAVRRPCTRPEDTYCFLGRRRRRKRAAGRGGARRGWNRRAPAAPGAGVVLNRGPGLQRSMGLPPPPAPPLLTRPLPFCAPSLAVLRLPATRARHGGVLTGPGGAAGGD